MEEPKGNIVHVCRHHFDDLSKETLKQIKEKGIKIKKGDYIKTRFDEGKYREHMWVRVEGLIGDKIIGKLDNIPEYITIVSYGDLVEVDINTITGYMNADNKIMINPLYDKIKEK